MHACLNQAMKRALDNTSETTVAPTGSKMTWTLCMHNTVCNEVFSNPRIPEVHEPCAGLLRKRPARRLWLAACWGVPGQKLWSELQIHLGLWPTGGRAGLHHVWYLHRLVQTKGVGV